jgi:Uma2 family endonuclease
MSTATLEPKAPAAPRQTTKDLLALPDDGVERWLVNGTIEEVGLTIRNKHHTGVESEVVYYLQAWLKQHPAPRGKVYSGEVGVILRETPELTVGIDVVYLNAEQATANDAVGDDETTILIAPITLATEVLSPTDTIEGIHRKLDWYAECGVPLVWVLNPYQRTVTVYRPGSPPQLRNDQDELDGGAELPGFRVPVARLFGL